MAGGTSTVRYVKCPKCRQLLEELADIPVYRCGGCGTVLRAKNRNGNNGSDSSGRLENIPSQNILSKHSSEISDSVSNEGFTTLSNQITSFLEDANNSEMHHRGEDIMLQPQILLHSDSEDNHHKKSESSEIRENENLKLVSIFDRQQPKMEVNFEGRSTTHIAWSQQDQGVQAKMTSCLNEQAEEFMTNHRGSGKSSPRNRMEGDAGSTDLNVVSEEDMVESPGEKPGDNFSSPSRSSHAYDGSVSSFDGVSNNDRRGRYRLLSRRTFRAKKVLESNSTRREETEKDALANYKMGTDMEAHHQKRILSTKSSDEKFNSARRGSFDLKQDELSPSYGIPSLEHEMSRDSEDFHSIKNWMELENDAPSKFLSKDSVFHRDLPPKHQHANSSAKIRNFEHDPVELLKKVDELRDQLSRSYNQEGKGDKKSHIQGTRPGIFLPLFQNHDTKQEYVQCYKGIPQYPSQVFGPRVIPQQNQLLQMPFSGQADNSCFHCHPGDRRIPVQLPPSMYCNNGLPRACPYHMRHQSSDPASPRYHNDCNVALCSHATQINNNEPGKLNRKEKHQPARRYCRPVSGAAPFLICYKCLELLQIPVDFLISRRRCHKLQCGACSKVLIFSTNGGHIVPYSDIQKALPPSETDNSLSAVSRHDVSVSHDNNCLPGEPVSYSEDYGPPFSRSYSTDEYEPVPIMVGNSPESTAGSNGGEAMGPPLHRLMGYSSATELMYQPSDEDEGYESRDLTRFYKSFHEIHMFEGCSPLQDNKRKMSASGDR